MTITSSILSGDNETFSSILSRAIRPSPASWGGGGGCNCAQSLLRDSPARRRISELFKQLTTGRCQGLFSQPGALGGKLYESLSARNVNLAQGFLCSKIQVINSSDHLHSTLQSQSSLHIHLLITTVQRCVIVVCPFYR